VLQHRIHLDGWVTLVLRQRRPKAMSRTISTAVSRTVAARRRRQ
jgi:hypothetical protein